MGSRARMGRVARPAERGGDSDWSGRFESAGKFNVPADRRLLARGGGRELAREYPDDRSRGVVAERRGLARIASPATAAKRFVSLARMHHFGAVWDGWEFWRGAFEMVDVEVGV